MWARIPLVVCFISILFFACNNPDNQLAGSWYYLRDGKFIHAESVSAVPETDAIAWQHQERIADIGILGDNPVFLVNGHGVAVPAIQIDFLTFDYYYNSVFNDNTATAFFEKKGQLFCHLYYDNAFRQKSEVQSEPISLCLLKVSFKSGKTAEFEKIQSLYHKKNRNWEAVGAYAFDESAIAIELKQSSEEYTQFGYTLYNLDSGEETEKTREWFTENFLLQEIDFSRLQDPSLSELFEKSIDILAGTEKPVIIHFNVRNQISHTEKRFRYASVKSGAQAEFDRVLVNDLPDQYMALFANGTVFVINKKDTGSLLRYQLPPLPGLHEYISFVFSNNRITAVWEETNDVDFYKTGKSGFFRSEEISTQ